MRPHVADTDSGRNEKHIVRNGSHRERIGEYAQQDGGSDSSMRQLRNKGDDSNQGIHGSCHASADKAYAGRPGIEPMVTVAAVGVRLRDLRHPRQADLRRPGMEVAELQAPLGRYRHEARPQHDEYPYEVLRAKGES